MGDWLFTEVEVRGVQLTAGDWARLAWGLAWRTALFALFAGACAFVAASLAAHSLPPSARQRFTAGVGVAVALLGLPLYMRWLLRARFGSLRLALVRTASRS